MSWLWHSLSEPIISCIMGHANSIRKAFVATVILRGTFYKLGQLQTCGMVIVVPLIRTKEF
jgi:hypothetical protein